MYINYLRLKIVLEGEEGLYIFSSISVPTKKRPVRLVPEYEEILQYVIEVVPE
jgi:hypothetical protein